MVETEPPPPQELIKEETFIMSSLPDEIMVDILSYLPVRSILRFRCVCKNWCHNLFKDPKFVKLHLNHAIGNNKYFSLFTGLNVPMYSVNWCHLSAHINEQSVVEIDSPIPLDEDFHHTYGSCNGLVLLYNPWELDSWVLWNPSTKEIKEIPEPIYTPISPSSESIAPIDYDFHDVFVFARYGFGYSPILDDYKIVIADIRYENYDWVSDGCQVHVYSLRSNSWKRIPDVVPYDLFLGGKAIEPVSCNGATHWIGSLCVSLKEGRELSIAMSIVIICFDVENDTFKEVPVAPELQESLCYDHRTILKNRGGLVRDESTTDILLGIYCGCLSLVQGTRLDLTRNNSGDVSIWVMKDYGVKESWTKLFSISIQSMERSIKYSKVISVMDFRNGMVLFLKDKSSLVVYDPKNETARVVNTGGHSVEGFSYVDTYVESLVSLDSGMYLGQGVLKSRLSCLARRMSELGA